MHSNHFLQQGPFEAVYLSCLESAGYNCNEPATTLPLASGETLCKSCGGVTGKIHNHCCIKECPVFKSMLLLAAALAEEGAVYFAATGHSQKMQCQNAVLEVLLLISSRQCTDLITSRNGHAAHFPMGLAAAWPPQLPHCPLTLCSCACLINICLFVQKLLDKYQSCAVYVHILFS